jgi:hypothetical protein
MLKRIGTWMMVVFLLSFFTSGCYYFSAKKEIGNAEKLLAELKGAGGEKKAPYEYCSAEKFLEGAKIEFSQNDFGPAKALADRSTAAAQAGLTEAKKK